MPKEFLLTLKESKLTPKFDSLKEISKMVGLLERQNCKAKILTKLNPNPNKQL
jgi:hypothetical protein